MPAATRPGPSGAPSVRSCCFQGAVAAMGPARTPLLRPAWLVAFLDRLKTPSEAPRTPARAGLRGPERPSPEIWN